MANKSAVRSTNPSQSAAVPQESQAAARSRNTGLVATFAAKYGIEPEKMLSTLKATAFRQRGKNGGPPPEVSNEQMFALLSVAKRYDLDPFVKEIYAFPTDAGGIVPMIGVDGWISVINRQPTLKGYSFEYSDDKDGEDEVWISCSVRRSDRDEPIVIREYLAECRRDTAPWRDMPRRMLRHKALIQAVRVAFGFAGIYDEDEAERIYDATAIDGQSSEVRGKPATLAPQATSSATAQLTHVPVDELLKRIDELGVPISEFCAEFEIGEVAELPLNQVEKAREYLDRVAAG